MRKYTFIVVILYTHILSAQEKLNFNYLVNYTYTTNFRVNYPLRTALFNVAFNDSIALYIKKKYNLYKAEDNIKEELVEKNYITAIPPSTPFSNNNSSFNYRCEYVITDINKNFSQFSQILIQDGSNIFRTIYDEPINFNWQLSSDTATIDNILCKKANCNAFGRSWVAWYSEAYPFPYGPYKFCGLPGLIIKIEDSTGTHKYEIYDFKKGTFTTTFDVINGSHDPLPVTKEKFLTLFDECNFSMGLFKNTVYKNEAVEKREQEMMLKKYKLEYNPLELDTKKME